MRVPRDHRKVRIEGPTLEFDYRPLSEKQWGEIESRLGGPLNELARTRIQLLTFLFACALDPSAKYMGLSRVAKKVDLWCKRTRLLANDLGLGNVDDKGPAGIRAARRTINKSAKAISLLTPHFWFARQLRAFEQIGRFFLTILDKRHFKGAPSNTGASSSELWLLWVATLHSCLFDAGIDVGQKKNKKRRAAFRHLVEELQNTIPFERARRRSGEPLTKAISAASHVATSDQFDGEVLPRFLVGIASVALPDGSYNGNAEGAATSARLKAATARLRRPTGSGKRLRKK